MCIKLRKIGERGGRGVGEGGEVNILHGPQSTKQDVHVSFVVVSQKLSPQIPFFLTKISVLSLYTLFISPPHCLPSPSSHPYPLTLFLSLPYHMKCCGNLKSSQHSSHLWMNCTHCLHRVLTNIRRENKRCEVEDMTEGERTRGFKRDGVRDRG